MVFNPELITLFASFSDLCEDGLLAPNSLPAIDLSQRDHMIMRSDDGERAYAVVKMDGGRSIMGLVTDLQAA